MPLFADVSDVVWQALIAGAVAVSLAWLQLKTRDAVIETGKKAESQADQAAIATDKVKKSLVVAAEVTATKLDELKKTTHDVHILVNSNMGTQLELNQVVTRRLADVTKDPADVKVAEKAALLFKKHQEQQAIVDRGEEK